MSTLISLPRRRFLKKIKALALTGSVPFLFDLQRIAAAAVGDYRALVCIFLNGGNDSHNSIIPYDTSDYNYYALQRQGLAVPRGNLLLLNQQGPIVRNFGLHPNLSGLQTLFNQQKLAIVANIGPLLHPITRNQYIAGTVPVPPNLLSHSDQIEQWQTCRPDQPVLTGWAGRVADLLHAQYGAASNISMLVSLAGNSTMHMANTVAAYQMHSGGTIPLGSYHPSSPDSEYRLMRRIVGARTSWHLLEGEYKKTLARSIETEQAISAALTQAPSFVFPETNLGRQLKMVARLIAVRNILGAQRQVFFCSQGGFDTHGDQLTDHPRLLNQVSQAMAAFYQATVSIGMADKVTTFTASDFGRTLRGNGSGSDHGWGADHFVMGGAVNGGRIYGVIPNPTVGGPDDSGDDGRPIPTTAVDQYAAKLAEWFGVSPANMPTVFPYLSRFNGTPSSGRLGFMI